MGTGLNCVKTKLHEVTKLHVGRNCTRTKLQECTKLHEDTFAERLVCTKPVQN